ncbi:unnamed protein product [Staurois parvus]|uniref:Uncharacterized protein n=1 Tax=Staurois parvus TaxID=386267 RepID=A0ABN9C430_9NEOB|nr:unnamed protein product [Staurois parvus]
MTVLGQSLHTAVSTAVWRECHGTVRNRLLMTVLGLSFHTAVETLYVFVSNKLHTMFQPLYGRTVQLSEIVYF